MNIVYATSARFPDSSAGTARMIGLGRALEAGGARVNFIGSQGTGDTADLSQHRLRGAAYASGDQLADGVRFMRAVRALNLGRGLVEWLDGWHAIQPIDAVLLYGGGAAQSVRLQNWSRRRGVPVVIDSVEWYEPSHVQMGRFGPFRFDHELCMRRIYRRGGNVIAISRYLEDHFASGGVHTLRVPPILDVQAAQYRIDDRRPGPLRLAYTGSPGRKDLLGVILAAIQRVDPDGSRLTLDVAGPDHNAFAAALREAKAGAIPHQFRSHGKVPLEVALELVRTADFTVLLREYRRYAIAGFSSKVPQSLAAGTPVITNLTGELDEYIREGETGLVVTDPTINSFAHTLERALMLDPGQIVAMRRSAREEAAVSFDIARHAEPLCRFFKELRVPLSSPARHLS